MKKNKIIVPNNYCLTHHIMTEDNFKEEKSNYYKIMCSLNFNSINFRDGKKFNCKIF